jgi:hypothetical protein
MRCAWCKQRKKNKAFQQEKEANSTPSLPSETRAVWLYLVEQHLTCTVQQRKRQQRPHNEKQQQWQHQHQHQWQRAAETACATSVVAVEAKNSEPASTREGSGSRTNRNTHGRSTNYATTAADAQQRTARAAAPAETTEATQSSVVVKGSNIIRANSSSSKGCTFMTSAPMSASICVPIGPDTICDRSRTRYPCSGPAQTAVQCTCTNERTHARVGERREAHEHMSTRTHITINCTL